MKPYTSSTSLHQTSLKTYTGYFQMVCFLLLLLSAGSCRKPKLQTLVDTANQECPIEVPGVGHITHIHYDEANVVYYFHIDENPTDIDYLHTHQEELKKAMKTMLSTPAPDIREMLNAMAAHAAGLQIICTGRESGKQTTCILSSDEIADCLRHTP